MDESGSDGEMTGRGNESNVVVLEPATKVAKTEGLDSSNWTYRFKCEGRRYKLFIRPLRLA